MAFVSLKSLFFLWIFVYVRSENCHHDCTITINRKMYPCSTIEEARDCKAEYISVKKGIETQINISSSQSQGFSKFGLYFKLLDFEKISNICYSVSQSIIPKHQKQEIIILCKDRISINKDAISKHLSPRSKRYPIDTLKARFNEKERILKITALTNECSKTCLIIFKKKKGEFFEAFFELPISTNQSIKLRIPLDMEELEWELYLDSSVLDTGIFNFSDLLNEENQIEEKQNFVDTQTCIHSFPDEWQIEIGLQTERNTIPFSIFLSVSCCEKIKTVVQLWKVSNTDTPCDGMSGTKIKEVTLTLKNGELNTTVFNNVSYGGSYCVRIHPIDKRCYSSRCPIKYSETKTITEAYVNSAVVQRADENNYEVLWIVIPTVVVVLMAFLIVAFRLRKRFCPNPPPAYDVRAHEELADKMKDVQKTSKQIILMLRCNEDEKKNRDIDQFIKFLERCCFCEVLHANSVLAHIDILETSAVDWLQDAIKKATKVIVVITDRASYFYNPAKYKEKEDPSSCLFTDRTFSIGVQMLKQRQDIRCIFARCCYTEELSSSELTEEVIEIPQALVHLFHCIHNKKSLIFDEAEIVDYWMADESFKYLHQLKPKENLSRKEVTEFPVHHNNVNQDMIISFQRNNTVSVDLEMNEADVNTNNNRRKAGLKLTNLHNAQNTHSLKLCDGQCDSGFSEC